MTKHILFLGTAIIALTTFAETAYAQASASPYTSATRYDLMGRVTGTISPNDPGRGYNAFIATRTTYDTAGRPTKVESGSLAGWQSEVVAPADWQFYTTFTIIKTVETTYNAQNQKLTEKVIGSDLASYSLTQFSYDPAGRLECTAVRMNRAAYGSLPASACTLGAEGTEGPDRITRNVYDVAGQLVQVREGVGAGSTIEAAEVTYGYTQNGKIEYVVDAGGHKARKCYDGYDRQSRWVFPSPTNPGSFNDSTAALALSTAGAVNGDCVATTGDYEAYGYDTNGNRTSLRKRDNSTLSYQYDFLNRNTKKTVPGTTTDTRDVYYAYDLRGLMTYAMFGTVGDSGQSTEGISLNYDGFGRKIGEASTMGGVTRAASFEYDRNSNRTRILFPPALYGTYGYVTFNYYYVYDQLNRLAAVTYADLPYPNGAPLKTWTYTDGGLPSGSAGMFFSSAYGYDPASRPSNIAHDLSGTSADLSLGFLYNPANQINSRTQSNDTYAWTGSVNVNRAYAANGLNQYTSAGSASFAYDANGNLTSDGFTTFTYDVENRLLSATGQNNATLVYDPLGRLFQTSSTATGTLQFNYDGDALIGEYDAPVNRLRAYVHASVGADTPVVWFEWTQAGRGLYTDHLGSIVAAARPDGAFIGINRYDEYGIPASTNQGRFQYTGQAWIPEVGMYYYKARMYSPTLGRFMQTDPIGYDDQFNLYAYVGNDPVNRADPTGNESACITLNTGCGMNNPDGNGVTADAVLTVTGAVVGFVAAVLDGPPGDEIPAAIGGARTGGNVGRAIDRATDRRVGPGPFARESMPAQPGRPTTAQQREINRIGQEHGCHTCGTKNPGTKSGNFVGDHQPPTKLNPPGGEQEFYPHCLNCSKIQGGRVSQVPPPEPPPLPRRPWWKSW